MAIPYIVRIDSNGWHAWWVRFQALKLQKSFTDKAYGSKRKALLAAITFRDKALSRYPSVRYKRHLYERNTRNKTGVVGISYRGYWKPKDNGGRYWNENYHARWTDPESRKQCHRSFSIKKYGKRGAKQLAIQLRLKMERKIKLYYRTHPM